MPMPLCDETQGLLSSTAGSTSRSSPPPLWDTNQAITNISHTKFSSIHSDFLTLTRKHLYQPSSPFCCLARPSRSSFTEQGVKTKAAGTPEKKNQPSFFVSVFHRNWDCELARSGEAKRHRVSRSPAVEPLWASAEPGGLSSCSRLLHFGKRSPLTASSHKGQVRDTLVQSSPFWRGTTEITYTSVQYRATSNLCCSQQCHNVLKVCIFNVLSGDKEEP